MLIGLSIESVITSTQEYRGQHALRVDLVWRTLPAGCIFASKGPAAFHPSGDLSALLGIANSKPFLGLVSLQMAFGSYEVGVIQRTPIPDTFETEAEMLGDLALRCIGVKRGFDTANETSHAFQLPAVLQMEHTTLRERLTRWQSHVYDGERHLAESQEEIDNIAFGLYGMGDEDRQAIEGSLFGASDTKGSDELEGVQDNKEFDETTAALDSGTLISDLLSYVVGCVLGRWDARLALDLSLAPKLADPFDPLPVARREC